MLPERIQHASTLWCVILVNGIWFIFFLLHPLSHLSWREQMRERRKGKSCVICKLSIVGDIYSELFIHSFFFLPLPPSRVYLSQLMRVYKCDKKSIANLLVKVNNNSITIEFLKMILSFSDVMFTNLSLPLNIFSFTLHFLIYDLILSSWWDRRNEKSRKAFCGDQKLWEYSCEIFFGVPFDLGRSSMSGKSQRFCCAVEDINLVSSVSWIKMRNRKNVFPFLAQTLFILEAFVQRYELAVSLLI